MSEQNRSIPLLFGALLLGAFLPGHAVGAQSTAPEHPRGATPALDCGFLPPAVYLEEIRRGVREGLIPDPLTKKIPPIAPGTRGVSTAAVPCLSSAQIHPFEDTAQLLLTNFSGSQLLDLMADAANDLMSVHGDNFDFIGYWLNFDPDHTIGSAFYMPIENNVMGLGDPSAAGTPIFNSRPALGLGGNNIEGYVMMWNVNSSFWRGGSRPRADFTRLALAQEFEHRFALFLPNLLNGRAMQGDDANCGRTLHWNWQVDGQGSGMEISEWVGSNPAVPTGLGISFNTEIPGSVFSYPDLYLMGYISPAEMDAGLSELRFMDNSNCSGSYNGPISTFTSADIIATAGPRIPDWTMSQKDWRTGWVMLHLPGDPPDQAELGKAVRILRQHMIDWNNSTLRRGTMDNTLFDECNTVTAYGCGVNPAGSLTVLSGKPEIGRSVEYGVDNPLGTQAPGSLPFLLFTLKSDPGFPCGTPLANFGMSGPGTSGELLISLARADRLLSLIGPPWAGAGMPASFTVQIPADVALLGASFFGQGVLVDPSVAFGVKFGLTEALVSVIEP